MMKKLLTITVLSVFVFILLSIMTIPHVVKAQNEDHLAGQILVQFKENTSQQEIDKQLNIYGAKVTGKIDKLEVFILKIPEAAREKLLAALSHNPNVEYAESDYLAKAFITPNDPYFTNQWDLENLGQTINSIIGLNDKDIDAPEAWDIATGSNNIKVAVLDCGINQNHEDLAGKITESQDFTGSTTGINDIYGHGTHVAGIVAALTNNSKGVAGVCPNCLLMNGKVLNDNGSGAYSWIANGIIWAVDHGAKVINLSLGGPSSSRTLENAVNYAWSKAVVVVAAAGNSNNQSKTYPAAYANAIAVAATDNQDKRAYFSSYGAKWVDVAAPGVYIFSTWKNSISNSNPQPICDDNECYKYASGTSMSTPVVSGIAGLVWSTSYGTSAQSVRNRIEQTADKISGTGKYWSMGRVNAFNAVK